MAKTAVVKASELQRASGKVLRRVAVGKEHLVVERDGYPVAVMMSYAEYEQLMRERALALHRDLVRALGREAEREDRGIQNRSREGNLDRRTGEGARITRDTLSQSLGNPDGRARL